MSLDLIRATRSGEGHPRAGVGAGQGRPPIEQHDARQRGPETYELFVRSFDRFRQVIGFVHALEALPGVRRVVLRQLREGTLHLKVQYAGATALERLLGQAKHLRPRAIEAFGARLELRLAPGESAAERDDSSQSA